MRWFIPLGIVAFLAGWVLDPGRGMAIVLILLGVIGVVAGLAIPPREKPPEGG
jgi:hypothetical protein